MYCFCFILLSRRQLVTPTFSGNLEYVTTWAGLDFGYIMLARLGKL